MKALVKVGTLGLCAILLVTLLFGCTKKVDYLENLDQSGVFDNSVATAIPQTKVAEMVLNHFAQENGKVKKAIIIGFDGARADSLYSVLCPGKQPTNKNEKSIYSGFNKLRDMGGQVALAYAGGVKGDENLQQTTNTAPGWASVLTGKLANDHKVLSNDGIISESTPTVLLQMAEKNKKVCFNYSWATHYDLTYTTEIKMNNENYQWNKCSTDLELQKTMQKSIDDNLDLIFGIFENPDNNGHSTGFTNENFNYTKAVVDNDRYSYELIEQIEKRETYNSEDWLIIMASDHGGTELGHGGQSDFERMTFIASNKKIL